MSFVDIRRSAGSDALGNQFQVIFPPFIGIDGINLTNINIRAKAVSIPEIAHGTYERKYRGITYTEPNGEILNPNEITVTFENDKGYNLYKSFLNWKRLQGDEDTDISISDETVGFRQTFSIIAIDTTNRILATWIVKDAYPSTVGGVDFSYDGGDPLDLEVTFQITKIIYPR